jgi:hypothetical protein
VLVTLEQPASLQTAIPSVQDNPSQEIRVPVVAKRSRPRSAQEESHLIHPPEMEKPRKKGKDKSSGPTLFQDGGDSPF